MPIKKVKKPNEKETKKTKEADTVTVVETSSKVKEEVASKLPEIPKTVDEIIGTPVEKKEYSGIGLVGVHPEIARFKGLLKMKSKVLGRELVIILKEWNEKNKI